jgi:sugar lactone lactonase YvrE
VDRFCGSRRRNEGGLIVIRIAASLAVLLLAAQTAVQPTNDLPNPYQTVENYFKMPDGRRWGATSAVDIDRDGRSIWVAERCGQNLCIERGVDQVSNLASILKFDASGKLVTSFGGSLTIFPHGIHVDREGNIWVTDGQDNVSPPAPNTPGPPPGATIGHQVFKFSPDGRLLMTLGKPGGGADPDYFYQPNDVLAAPNGDIFVAEGHGGANSRILKFTKDGKLIKVIGKKGSGPGEFDQPHALAMDSRGRLFVGDRGNNRIQILDQEGGFIADWRQFSRASGLYIDRNDILYAADSESGSAAKNRPEWKRGIRIGSARDGKVTAFIPDPNENATGTSAAEGVAVDAQGNIYGAEVGSRSLKKYVKK